MLVWINLKLYIELFLTAALLTWANSRRDSARHSVIVIEHNLDLVAEADWVIDLGPEGGKGGGQLVCEGTPEAVARNKRSHTGRFLRSVLRQA